MKVVIRRRGEVNRPFYFSTLYIVLYKNCSFWYLRHIGDLLLYFYIFMLIFTSSSQVNSLLIVRCNVSNYSSTLSIFVIL